MKNPDSLHHPVDDPNFNVASRERVWYLSHPLESDERYSFEENMKHVKHMMRLCIDAGFRVIAPYHTICLVLDDDNPEHRRIGLETDCSVAYALGQIIMAGHKMSKGMTCELEAVHRRIDDYCTMFKYDDTIRSMLTISTIIDITQMSDAEARHYLHARKVQDG